MVVSGDKTGNKHKSTHTHTHTHTHEQASGANAGWLMKLSAKDFSRFFVVVVLFR